MMRLLNMRSAVSIVGVIMGIGGASHGPGEILQGNIAPNGLIIQAWPGWTEMGGQAALIIVPSYFVTGVLTIILGLAVTIWAAKYVHEKNGGLVLIVLSIIMLLVGGGLVPPMRARSVELNKNDHIRLRSLNGDYTSIEGSLGGLLELELVEGVFLSIKGAYGTLSVDLTEEELKKLLQNEKRKVVISAHASFGQNK